MLAFLPRAASAQISPEKLAELLAGAPCTPPPDILGDLQELAGRSNMKDPQSRALIVKILKRLYRRGSPLAWEAVPFASRPGRLANQTQWGAPP